MKYSFLTIAALLSCLCASAFNPANVRWHNEATDTIRITEILQSVAGDSEDPQSYVPAIARQFLDKPYVASTLESADGRELITVDLDRLDCTTFVETVGALAQTAAEGSTSWRDFVDNLEGLRYRSGSVDGYASRLHYIADWVVDNSSRGNVSDRTAFLAHPDYVTKTLDFMSTHRGSYSALKDDEQFSRIKKVEEGLRMHRFPYVRKSRIIAGEKEVINALAEGDIIALTTDLGGLDVSHMAIITMVNGKPHMMHASSTAGKVIVDPLTLAQYLKRSKRATGIRILRFTL